MKTIQLIGAAATALCLQLSAANADVVTYNQNLTTPGGWFDGSGNPNGAFTVSTLADGTQIALRAKLRQDPNTIASVNNIFNVATGSQIGAPTYWAWNYEFGVACPGVGACSLGGNVLGNVQSLLLNSILTMTDLTTGISNSIFLGSITDDSTWHGAGAGAEGTELDLDSYIAQNSENGKFTGIFPTALADRNANDFYQLTLDLRGASTGPSLGSDTIFIAAGNAVDPRPVPEPLTLSLFGAGALGLMGLRRRKNKTA